MSRFYAQLLPNLTCFAVSELAGEVISADMIELTFFDESRIGLAYDVGTDTWGPGFVEPIRKITTQAFYRRMTPAERNAVRTNMSDPVQDLREDLQRSPVVDLDGAIEAQLQATGGFTQTRIDELLIDGTEAEQETG